MIRRRDLLIAASCLGALGVAEGLRPRRRLSLAKGEKIEKAIPMTFGNWVAEDYSELVRPKDAKSLSATLYNETVGRTYRNTVTRAEVMMLIAYGDTQSDLLQLHRPESCYPAFGFSLSGNKPATIALKGAESIPGRQLVANAQDHQENIIYWTRLGEYFPISAGQQRSDRLSAAMHGYIPDGLLARFSVLGADPERGFATIRGFVPDLLQAISPDKRPAFIGTDRNAAMTKQA